MSKKSVWCLACLLPAGLLFWSVPTAWAQEPPETTAFTAGAAEISISGRVQTQFNTTSVEDVPTSALFLRRARLGVEVRVNDIVSGVVESDFAGNEVSLKDVYLKLNFGPGFQLLAGKAYKPFSLLEQTSSTRILPIERGAVIRGIPTLDEYEIINALGYSDRDIGLQVMGAPTGAPLGLAYTVGVFQGPLYGGVGAQDSYQFATRATITPVEKLTFGAGWSSRDFAGPTNDDPELERGNAFELDAEYGSFSPGLHLLGEVAFGDLDPFTGSDFVGAQAWVGYRTRRINPVLSTIEPLLRVSYGDPDRALSLDPRGGTLLTPGINLYFGGLNRIMLNYDVWLPDGEGDSEQSFKAMFQLAF